MISRFVGLAIATPQKRARKQSSRPEKWFPFQWFRLKSLNGKLRRHNASLEDARSIAWRLCALRFIETFDDTISLQPGEPIDPKDPIKLIDLMLETHGEQTIGLFDLFHAAQILVAHPHTGMAFDLFRYARRGDAAFFVPDHVGGSPDDLRVHRMWSDGTEFRWTREMAPTI